MTPRIVVIKTRPTWFPIETLLSRELGVWELYMYPLTCITAGKASSGKPTVCEWMWKCSMNRSYNCSTRPSLNPFSSICALENFSMQAKLNGLKLEDLWRLLKSVDSRTWKQRVNLYANILHLHLETTFRRPTVYGSDISARPYLHRINPKRGETRKLCLSYQIPCPWNETWSRDFYPLVPMPGQARDQPSEKHT